MKKSVLRSYANLLARVGLNVQKGQDVIVFANVNDEYFIKYVVEECYNAGARIVNVQWSSDEVTKVNYKKASVEALSEFQDWKKEKWEYEIKTLPARIYIESEDPDALASVNQNKITKVNQIVRPQVRVYRDRMDNHYQWCIAGIPGEKWAKKMFPELTKTQAFNKLWDVILDVTRAKGDPIKNWELHNKNLMEKTNWVNSLGIKKLIYKASNGTDFSVCLKEGIVFDAGDAKTFEGIKYNPNMPTEECFTSPDKDSANGVVYASKPLSIYGNVIDGFGFRFENGKIVEVLCENEKYKELLEQTLDTDEGARRLGEVALVPFDSPINKTGLLFYSTLYDENACCHLAFGAGFEECIKDFDKKTKEEIDSYDINKSAVHYDFMIGTSDLSITAETYDGKTVEIFKNGTWA